MTADLRVDRRPDSPTPAVVGPVDLQADSPNTYLALSAVAELRPDDPRVATAIEHQLERIDRASTMGQRWRLIDELLMFVWGPVE